MGCIGSYYKDALMGRVAPPIRINRTIYPMGSLQIYYCFYWVDINTFILILQILYYTHSGDLFDIGQSVCEMVGYWFFSICPLQWSFLKYVERLNHEITLQILYCFCWVDIKTFMLILQYIIFMPFIQYREMSRILIFQYLSSPMVFSEICREVE